MEATSRCIKNRIDGSRRSFKPNHFHGNAIWVRSHVNYTTKLDRICIMLLGVSFGATTTQVLMHFASIAFSLSDGCLPEDDRGTVVLS